MLSANRLVPLRKPAPGTLHPIAIPTVWRKLWATVTSKKWSTAIQDFLGGDQFGAGTALGTLRFAKLVQSYTEDPAHVAISLDIENAFSSLDRRAVIAAMHEIDPVLASTQRQWPCHVSPAAVPAADPAGALPYSSTGLPQGDPMSALAFAAGLCTALRRFRADDHPKGTPRVPAYVDDMVLLCEVQHAHAAFDRLGSCLKEEGLTLNTKKTVVYTTCADGPPPGKLRELWLSQGRTDGMVKGGLPVQHDPLQQGDDEHQAIPVGSSNYIEDFLDGKLEDMRRRCHVLTLLPATLDRTDTGVHVALHLLRISVSRKPVHLLAAIPPLQAQRWAKQVDDVCSLAQQWLVGWTFRGLKEIGQ